MAFDTTGARAQNAGVMTDPDMRSLLGELEAELLTVLETREKLERRLEVLERTAAAMRKLIEFDEPVTSLPRESVWDQAVAILTLAQAEAISHAEETHS